MENILLHCLKSNCFYARNLTAPGQRDTKSSVARAVEVKNKHMALARCSKDFRLESGSCFCGDLPDAREQESIWLDDMFLLMTMQSTELASGSQLAAGCAKHLVAPVERELSWKTTLSEVSKGAVGCHQRYPRG